MNYKNIILILLLICSICFANSVNGGGQKGLVRTYSAGIQMGGEFTIGNSFQFMQDKRISMTLISNSLYFSIGLFDFIDLNIDIPYYKCYDLAMETKDKGFGDLDLGVKFNISRDASVWQNGLLYNASFPTGARNEGYFPRYPHYTDYSLILDRGNFYSATVVTHTLLYALTLDFMNYESNQFPVKIHGNIGAIISELDKNAFIGNIGVEARVFKIIDLFTELSSVARFSFDKVRYQPLTDGQVLLTPGVKFNLPNGVALSLAANIGLSHLKSERYYNVLNVNNKIVHRSYDYMYNAFDGFQIDLSWSGNSQKDTDGDGIIDRKDDCPEEPEDFDGFEDEDGCPDYDNDKDGIVDLKDECPNVPEDFDGFEDEDGCPDYDNDKDGVLDVDDDCPNIPGLARLNGCPEKITKKLILKGVNFHFNKATLTEQSRETLDNVVNSLKAYEKVEVQIHGHTDGIGTNKYNYSLSIRRAMSVKYYFVNHGIDESRLTITGYGEERPIAPNNTKDGRAKNRRVELHPVD